MTIAAALGQGDGAAGIFNAGFGAGAILGAAASLIRVGRARLTPFLALGIALLSFPIAVLAWWITRGSALLLFAAAGVGLSVLKIGGTTLLQRAAPTAVASRVFGILEGLQMGAMALGSLLLSAVTESLGLRTTLIMLGVATPGLMAFLAPRLSAMDRHAVSADARIVARLRNDPMFAPLSAPAIERLALDAATLSAPAAQRPSHSQRHRN